MFYYLVFDHILFASNNTVCFPIKQIKINNRKTVRIEY